MPEIFIPNVSKGASPVTRVAIDPITRIEGHLRIEVQIEGGQVANAWSSGTMFRGLEIALRGRDPRDAWIYTQRICGVCTTVHAITSVRAVENALSISVPDNARIVRNVITGTQYLQDHVMHFYHLHALDWVDITSALTADPTATSVLQRSLSDWPNSSPSYFSTVQSRLQAFVNSGQLGLFANGYWGHPAYRLPPEVNLLAVAHYLEALDWQRDIIKIQAILGGKNPHPQTFLVGGMATPVHPTLPNAINNSTIATLQGLVVTARNFVEKVYLPDLKAIAGFYPEWTQSGGGRGDMLSYGEFPEASNARWLPPGIVRNGNLGQVFPVDHMQIVEHVAHSWYAGNTPRHPWQGETQPAYAGPAAPYALESGTIAHVQQVAAHWDGPYQPEYDMNGDGQINVGDIQEAADSWGSPFPAPPRMVSFYDKYSWIKAPRYQDAPMEVGPLARMSVAYAAGHPRVRAVIDTTLAQMGLGPAALFSTVGRMLARAVETLVVGEQLPIWLGQLQTNINQNNLTIHNSTRWDPSTWPADALGYGFAEAPRGALGHWVHIVNGQIDNYQAVVPTTWNGSPRDAAGLRGPWEQALIGTPVADPQRPVEILRTIHSFDPCMSCAVHIVDEYNSELTRVQVRA